jgi:hypothetical protein
MNITLPHRSALLPTQIQEPPLQRGRSSPRTVDTLKQDYQNFLTKGNGDVNKAKEYNNVIRPPIFHIPIDGVKEN